MILCYVCRARWEVKGDKHSDFFISATLPLFWQIIHKEKPTGKKFINVSWLSTNGLAMAVMRWNYTFYASFWSHTGTPIETRKEEEWVANRFTWETQQKSKKLDPVNHTTFLPDWLCKVAGKKVGGNLVIIGKVNLVSDRISTLCIYICIYIFASIPSLATP